MILGIDLGTTNSLACVYKDDRVIQIPNFLGEYLTPSVVSFDEEGKIIVGQPAKERRETCPERTYSSFKRYMGTDKVFGIYKPEELSSYILMSLKQDAEKFLGEKIEDAIISVPAYFSDKARHATKMAGALAGFNVLRIINEPSAAALGFMMKSGKLRSMDMKEDLSEETFLVFDFGGGTLDVSLVETFDNIIEIVSVSGDNQLGGIDFDSVLTEHFLHKTGIRRNNISDSTYNSILVAAEKCKRELSSNKTAKMTVRSEKVNTEIDVTDIEFLKLSEKVIKRIDEPINTVLSDAHKCMSDITGIVMVGGSSKMPIVQIYLKYLNKKLDLSVFDPDFMVAYGMGVYAGIMERNDKIKDLILTDVCPFSLGTSSFNARNGKDPLMTFIIPRNSPLPISRKEKFTTSRPFQQSIEIDVYQGEDEHALNNKLINRFNLRFPKPAEVGTVFEVTYTYDIDGILIINVDVPAFDIHKEVVLGGAAKKELIDVSEKVRQLKELKILTIDDEEDKYVREWGNKLYAISPFDIKEEINIRMSFYKHIKASGDIFRIMRVRKSLIKFYKKIEDMLSQYTFTAFTDDNPNPWDNEVDEDVRNLFDEWTKENNYTDGCYDLVNDSKTDQIDIFKRGSEVNKG